MSPTPTLVQTNGHLVNNGTTGSRQYRQTVRQFFEQFSWNGVQIAAPTTGANQPAVAAPLRLTLSVQQFFNRFSWEGTPTIGGTVTPTAPMNVDDLLDGLDGEVGETDVTLDDFSDLFG